eukprot:83703-Ditylum_brightwellii.AAC.1
MIRDQNMHFFYYLLLLAGNFHFKKFDELHMKQPNVHLFLSRVAMKDKSNVHSTIRKSKEGSCRESSRDLDFLIVQ